MHTKIKGTAGELFVAHYLYTLGYSVFTELGDISRVDLIALCPKPIRIQVKSYSTTNDRVDLHFKKSGPNYQFNYRSYDFDVIALHVVDKNIILWIPSSKIETSKSISFNFKESRQKSKVNKYTDYTDFNQIIKGDIPTELPSLVS